MKVLQWSKPKKKFASKRTLSCILNSAAACVVSGRLQREGSWKAETVTRPAWHVARALELGNFWSQCTRKYHTPVVYSTFVNLAG